MVVVDGGGEGQGARGEVDTGEGGRGREGEGEASEGERARADEGARARAMVDIWHGGRQWQATKAGFGGRGGAAA